MTTTHDTGTDNVRRVAPDRVVTEDPIVYPYVLHGLDPRTLRADGNSREVGDIRDTRPALVASVAEHGVDPKISIINVVPDPDGVLAVLVGFHRHAAAVAVKERENPALTVDVLVHAPGTRREVLVAQGIENIHREGYTTIEEAELYGQLALEGVDAETIARTLSRPAEHVTAGLAVAASDRTRAAGKALPTADMFLLLQLAEFDDDEEAHTLLVDVLATRPRQFQYTLGQLRDQREQRAVPARETQRFTDLGYALVDDEDDLPETVERLDALCAGDDDAPLDPAGHADCPGRAVSVWVYRDQETDVRHYCLDYTAHGHRTRSSARIAAAVERLRADGVPIVAPTADGAVSLTGCSSTTRPSSPPHRRGARRLPRSRRLRHRRPLPVDHGGPPRLHRLPGTLRQHSPATPNDIHDTTVPCSPRERGWSVGHRLSGRPARVLPARAGVARLHR